MRSRARSRLSTNDYAQYLTTSVSAMTRPGDSQLKSDDVEGRGFTELHTFIALGLVGKLHCTRIRQLKSPDVKKKNLMKVNRHAGREMQVVSSCSATDLK